MNKEKNRLFVDIDGTLAEWRNIQIDLEENEDAESAAQKLFDILQTPGYFFSLRPNKNVVNAVKEVIQKNNVDVYILTCYPPDKEIASPKKEKDMWLDKYLPEIDSSHRIYVPYGEAKSNYVPKNISKSDFLFDDKTSNLEDFEQMGGTGIKLLNGINSTFGSWRGNQINYLRTESHMAKGLEDIVVKNTKIVDAKPPRRKDSFDYNNFNFKLYAEEMEDLKELE